MADADARPVRDPEGAPSDAFRRASVLLGIIGLDLSSLAWMFGTGWFVLLPPPSPASKLGTSQIVIPLVVGLASVVVLMYRGQVDARAGQRRPRLLRLALVVAVTTASLGALALAMNLVWILPRI